MAILFFRKSASSAFFFSRSNSADIPKEEAKLERKAHRCLALQSLSKQGEASSDADDDAEDISSVATEEMSSVATEEMSSVATEEMSSVATEEMWYPGTQSGILEPFFTDF